MDPITGLAWGRVGVGVLSLVAPKLAARSFLLDPGSNPQVPYVTRLFGSREIALGGLTLVSTGSLRRQLVQIGIAVDGADALTGLTGLVSGSVPKKAALLMTVVAGGAVASGVQGLDA